MKEIHKNRGITLISLVITIVILLILAGITMNSLSDNGLFEKTKKAKKEAEYTQAQEEINIKIMEAQMDKRGEATLEDLVKVLKEDSKYTYIIKFDSTALLSQSGDIKGIETDEELKTQLSSINAIYVTHKGYEFEINSKLQIKNQITSSSENIPELYTISYNLLGGVGEISNQTKTAGEKINISTIEPTKENYTFKGWTTIEGGTTVEYIANQEYTDNRNLTLYAIWERKIATITFNSNTGTGIMQNMQVYQNEDTNLIKNTFEKSGYKFVKWNTKQDGTGNNYNDEGNVKTSENITLYAIWEDVFLLKNGVLGSGLNFNNITYVQGQTNGVPFKFENGTINRTLKMGGASGSTTTLNEKISINKLYAKLRIKYAISHFGADEWSWCKMTFARDGSSKLITLPYTNGSTSIIETEYIPINGAKLILDGCDGNTVIYEIDIIDEKDSI